MCFKHGMALKEFRCKEYSKKMDSEYNGTLFIIVFKKVHSDDAEKLLDALQKISDDIYMTETASFFQIYLSKKTTDKIWQLKGG